MLVQTEFKKILVPVDFSDCSRKAFYVALKLAKVFGSETYVVHVQEPISLFATDEDVERQTKEMNRVIEGVKRRVNELFDKGGIDEVDRRRVRTEIRAGKPYLEIVKFAVQEHIDLIVMGSHGYTGVNNLLIGSQVEKVIRRAPMPVLCIKPDDFEIGSDITGV